jgi:hypothetical protein
MLRKCGLALAILLAVALGAHGFFALVSPLGWYAAFRGVTANGATTQYALRDIRTIFLFAASGLLVQCSHLPILAMSIIKTNRS